VRQLTLATHGMRISPNIRQLPKNFTLEADYAFGPHSGMATLDLELPTRPGWLPHDGRGRAGPGGRARITAQAGPIDQRGDRQHDGSVDQKQPMTFALWCRRPDPDLRQRQATVDVNQIALGDINLSTWTSGWTRKPAATSGYAVPALPKRA